MTIYDWNREGDFVSPPLKTVRFFDETLRDGIQCPSATDPSIEEKMKIVRLLDKIGVHDAEL